VFGCVLNLSFALEAHLPRMNPTMGSGGPLLVGGFFRFRSCGRHSFLNLTRLRQERLGGEVAVFLFGHELSTTTDGGAPFLSVPA